MERAHEIFLDVSIIFFELRWSDSLVFKFFDEVVDRALYECLVLSGDVH
jgi:hypothetical protein